MSFSDSIPDLLAGKVNVSEPYQNCNAKGTPTSFGVDLDFPALQLSKTLKSSEFHLLHGKIEDTLQNWEKKHQRHLDMQHRERRSDSVADMNNEAKETIEALHGILAHTLDIHDAVDWDAIKRKDAFRIKPHALFSAGKKPDFLQFETYGRPTDFDRMPHPAKPILEDTKKLYGFFSRLFRGQAIQAHFEERLDQWRKECEQADIGNVERETRYNEAVAAFDALKKVFEEEKQHDNDALEEIKSRYGNADPNAIEEYCDLVLNSSDYPDYFPQNWILEYRADARMVVANYDLPSPDRLPTVESYKYIKARDEITEKPLTETARKKLYDSVIYQVCIRTLHELLEADVINALDTAAFNGLVTHTNPATGIKETKTIISVSAAKEAFMAFDLSQVDPKATFKHLKGVAAATLVNLTPIPPVIKLDKADKRFIDSKEVAMHLDESVNIAAMHWEDFEHLVGELFEKEFTTTGGEVKVTQASADGGVDAVAFDPDPIRGGKIVIQAKRYTNTVGVAAVRDLYGTVMNEGATKGILVTTSDYGKDSYEFAKDKPLTLLNGSNLLALLEKHGHPARIDVTEAKKILRG